MGTWSKGALVDHVGGKDGSLLPHSHPRQARPVLVAHPGAIGRLGALVGLSASCQSGVGVVWRTH